MRLCVVLLLLLPTTVFAGSLQLPAVPLPAGEPSQPVLLFSPSSIPTLQLRRTNPYYSGHYGAVKGFVDGQLVGLKANPVALGDDSLSKIARGAALLQQLGEVPPAQFATYRDAAVVALKNIVTRNPSTLFGGTNAINVLQDAPRLQSMAEAYDLLRGTGVAAGDDAAMRTVIGAWGEAMRNDYNIAGAIGIPGHRDNWGVKGGSALISVALALTTDSRASNWLQTGLQYVNESLAAVASDTGWWRESPHYLNYSLNNLVLAAWHVKSRTGVDWFPAMKVFATTALAMRQPDGLSTPFEEGVSDVFPYDVMADRYPDIAPSLRWAWSHSSGDASAFENQALQEATRFVMNSEISEQEPTIPSTQFVGADAHVQVLRSDWSPNALQATMISAKDHSSSTLYASRHNMQNSLDLTVFGAGQLLLPTSGGGPQVTTSANRSYYLLPSSRNMPLVGGTAPFITDESKISSDSRLDGVFLDSARTNVTAYAGASRVSRLLATIDGRAVVLVDEAIGSGNVDLAIPFHGRGSFTSVSASGPKAQARWDFQGSSLDLWTTSERAFSMATNTGYYANLWNQEEALTDVQMKVNGAAPRLLSLLVPRSSMSAAPTVLTAAGSIGFTVDDGAGTDTVTTGANALLGVVHTVSGAMTRFSVVRGTRLESGGVSVLSSASPVTVDGVLSDGVLDLKTTIDGTQSFALDHLEGIDAVATGYAGFVNGRPAGASFAQANGQFLLTSIPAGAAVRIQPSQPPSIDRVGDQAVLEGEALQIQATASDPDGQPLTFSMTSTPPLPMGATIDLATGFFRWTPGFTVAGRDAPASFQVTLSASDGFLSATTTFTLTVTNVNRAPVLLPAGDRSVTQGETLNQAMVASDPDGDELSWSLDIQPLPPELPTIDSAGVLTWSPSADVPPGRYLVSVRVSDGLDTVADGLMVDVVRLNHAPHFTSLDGLPLPEFGSPTVSGTAGESLSFTLGASDEDHDPVVFTLQGAPTAFIEPATGTVSWTPTASGLAHLVAVASDDHGGSDTLDILVELLDPPIPDGGPAPLDGGLDETDGGTVSDAGIIDAGVNDVDAGWTDAGTIDAGSTETADGGHAVDAGEIADADAGAAPRTVPAGCGCGNSPGSLLGLLALAIVRSRARKPAAAGKSS